MVGKITDVLILETSDNDRSIAHEGLIISSDQEGNDGIHNKNSEMTLPDGFASITPIIVAAIDNISNIKCKHRDIKKIYWYVSKTVVTTNESRDFIESIAVELVNKKLNIQQTNSTRLRLIFHC